MMWVLIITGSVSFIFGILLLSCPEVVRDISAKTARHFNQMLFSVDDKVYTYRVGIGVSAVLIAIMCFFVIYYLIRMYG